MSGKINLREIFMIRLRNEFFTRLLAGPLKGWDYQTVVGIVDEAIMTNNLQITTYLYEQNVTLLNMDEHIKALVSNTLLPYLNSKRVQ